MDKDNICFLLQDTQEDTEEIIDTTFFMQELLDEFNKNNQIANIENTINYCHPNVNHFYFDMQSKDIKNIKDIKDIQCKGILDKCNINDLYKICDYYGLLKNIKLAKYKKNEIIQSILLFENDDNNLEIVNRRYQMWHYINELSKDKYMKKYVIWT